MRFTNTFVASAVITIAHGATVSNRALSGQATFYGGNIGGGMCSFSTYTLPAGVFGTALSSSNWDGSANCGACVSVKGPNGNSVTAMVVDQCPECGLNALDLFPDAFSSLADKSKGKIPITWNFVDCPISSPLAVHNKEGVSAYWFSMQVVNANKEVVKLEVSTNGGTTWQATERQPYNFFQKSSGFGTTTVDVKVTSADGLAVILKSVKVIPGASTTASSNFGSSANDAPIAKGAFKEISTSSTGAVDDVPATSLPGAVFNEASYAASPVTDHSTTTIRSTTTRTRTTTIKSTYTQTSTPSSTSTYFPPNTISSLFVTAAVNSSTSVGVVTATVTYCSSSVQSSPVPIFSTPVAISTETVLPVQNTSIPLITATPTVFIGAASSKRVSAVIAIFAGVAAHFLI